MYSTNYYDPTAHFGQRYRERMSEHVKRNVTKKHLLEESDKELARRANYMLLFSVHGRPGDTDCTEVRYYFDWNIIIDNSNRKIVTMYIADSRKQLPARLFGDRKLRKVMYDLWFKPNSKYRREV